MFFFSKMSKWVGLHTCEITPQHFTNNNKLLDWIKQHIIKSKIIHTFSVQN